MWWRPGAIWAISIEHERRYAITNSPCETVQVGHSRRWVDDVRIEPSLPAPLPRSVRRRRDRLRWAAFLEWYRNGKGIGRRRHHGEPVRNARRRTARRLRGRVADHLSRPGCRFL